jgi:hypothetical protein
LEYDRLIGRESSGEAAIVASDAAHCAGCEQFFS